MPNSDMRRKSTLDRACFVRRMRNHVDRSIYARTDPREFDRIRADLPLLQPIGLGQPFSLGKRWRSLLTGLV